jgi:hypothetical protein
MSQEQEPGRRGGTFRQVLTPPVMVASAICVVIGVAIGFFVAPRGSGHPTGLSSPSTLSPSASPSSAPASRSSSGSSASSFSQAIPLGAACKWAYPDRATGQVSGDSFSIVCLGPGGQPLGGFSKSHSLNAWCADPSHTHGYAGTQPELIGDVWYCAGSGNASSLAPGHSPAPSPSTSISVAAPPTSSSAPSAQPTSKPTQGPVSVPIPLGAACKWAYPAQASGQVSGSGYSIVCLGMSGQPLGGFSSDHSLNAWCADPSHTNHKHLPDPELHKGKWVCTKT